MRETNDPGPEDRPAQEPGVPHNAPSGPPPPYVATERQPQYVTDPPPVAPPPQPTAPPPDDWAEVERGHAPHSGGTPPPHWGEQYPPPAVPPQGYGAPGPQPPGQHVPPPYAPPNAGPPLHGVPPAQGAYPQDASAGWPGHPQGPPQQQYGQAPPPYGHPPYGAQPTPQWAPPDDLYAQGAPEVQPGEYRPAPNSGAYQGHQTYPQPQHAEGRWTAASVPDAEQAYGHQQARHFEQPGPVAPVAQAAPSAGAQEAEQVERPEAAASAAPTVPDADRSQQDEQVDDLEAVARAVQVPPGAESHREDRRQDARQPERPDAAAAGEAARRVEPVVDTVLPPAGDEARTQRPRIKLARREDRSSPAEAPFPGPVKFGKVHPRAGEPRGLPQVEQAVPDTVLDLADFDGLAVRAASLRGDDHRWTGKPRQDSLGLWTVSRQDRPDLLVAAVADGVGSRSLSHLGSSWACRLFREQIAAHAAEVLVQDDIEDLGRRIAERIAAAMIERAGREGLERRELSTTLVGAAVELTPPPGPRRCFLVRVGDSTAYLLREGGFGEAFDDARDDEEIVGSATAALPTSVGRVQTAVETVGADDVLVLCTDGLVGPMRNDEVRDRLVRCWSGPVPGALEFGWQVGFRARSFGDDRTAVCVWGRR
ncbi:protein phosphatase 2C domain-containing protein [Thermomonospora cellulosilytica]|uniref:Serine/threonine protein phosphatase PrpC n=1 Tax=Thermomonospora cellulosilytica TaxID=1411118 RepID=A0A7W3MV73_9ACTN|nr:protein phosphatase 2C domain-containing protein [Thermomonospora cellulosilytica]MBA9002500.1 serine/threonine protein phosphatase PrpC [Thermomonospora cellulosilytica]